MSGAAVGTERAPLMAVMVYGANGYVGGLLVEAAASTGIDVVAAGRSRAVVLSARPLPEHCIDGGRAEKASPDSGQRPAATIPASGSTFPV